MRHRPLLDALPLVGLRLGLVNQQRTPALLRASPSCLALRLLMSDGRTHGVVA